MRILSRGLTAAAFVLLAVSASAQEMDHMKMDHMQMDHGSMSMDHGSMSKGADGPAAEAYRKANAAMHSAMEQTFTNDPDRDFVRGMIPHHQGAIEMARVVLKYGKDPEVKKLAQQIVEAQEREIAEMKQMLARLDSAAK